MGKAKILVVEDEAIIARDLQWRLQGMGYEVPYIVATGEDAVIKVQEFKPDLVLMDIMLLGPMDGIQTADKIRATDDIPVMYLTSYADEEIVERAKITEPFAYLIKPIGDRELYSGIELTLSKHRTEKQLRENEKWLSTVLSSIGDAVITTNTEGNIVFMNPAAEGLTGWSIQEALGKDVEEVFNIINEKTEEKITNPVHKVLTKKTVTTLAHHTALITRSGTKIPIADSSAPIKDEDNNFIGVVLVFSDITERKKAEEALRKSEEQVRLLLNSAAEAIYGLDLEGNCTFCNPSSLRLLGFEKEEDLLGRKMHNLVHHTRIDASPYPEGHCRIYEVMKSGKGVHVDDEVLWRADGSSFYAEYRCYPVKADGSIIGAVVTFLDITERRQAEKFIQNILESVGEGFIVIGKDFRILSANRAFCDFVKMPVEEIIGKHCYEISHHIKKPCYEAGEECPVNTTFQTGKPHTIIHTHYDKEGKPSFTETRSYAMKDESGEVLSVIETINDITEKKRLESQLRHAQKMEAVGHLAGGVAHDFNNILTAITGYGNLLKMKTKEDDPARYNIDQILASVERGANLTQSLLAFSRKQIMNPRPINFNTIVESVLRLLKRLIGEDIELTTKLTKEDVTVMADSGQIEQILMNLATNARDAMPDGGTLTIETERQELDKEYVASHGFGVPGSYILISIADSGMGMDEETRSKIFEPFFTTKEVGKGTGLGLAMIYGIIKQHMGYINVYSEPEEGTIFRIYLPLIEKEVEKVTHTEAAPSVGGTETILLAEDDDAARNLTKTVLEQFGYTVIEAKNGEEAIERFSENKDRIQLLVLDVIMPKKSGPDSYEAIRKTTPNAKAIFISGYTADIILKKGVDKERLNFVSKPFSPQDILKKIREVLDSG
jgi:two-component system NtrC family sensor kinase